MATSYRRVSVLLPVPPYNQNSAFILEKNDVKKYVNNLELINKDKKKKKKTYQVANVRNPGSNPGDRRPILLPPTKKRRKISSTPAATSTAPSDNYSGPGPTPTTITHSRPPQHNHITFTQRKQILPNIQLNGTHIIQTRQVKYPQFAGECRGVQTCVQCPAKSTKQHVTIQLLLSAETCRRVSSAL